MEKPSSADKAVKKVTKKAPQREATNLPLAECKDQILLRNVPCEVIQRINAKKIEIMQNNPRRTTVSHSEAIFKLILKS
jgi:hypothetical protein